MDVYLRPAHGTDLDAVGELLSKCKLAPNAFDRQFGPNFVVAISPDRSLVGVAGVERYGDAGLFRSAAVLPELQGLGIGTRLTRDRIDWARAQDLKALYLLTETAPAYWPRFGFVEVPRDSAPEPLRASREWSGGCPATAIAMSLDLQS